MCLFFSTDCYEKAACVGCFCNSVLLPSKVSHCKARVAEIAVILISTALMSAVKQKDTCNTSAVHSDYVRTDVANTIIEWTHTPNTWK